VAPVVQPVVAAAAPVAQPAVEPAAPVVTATEPVAQPVVAAAEPVAEPVVAAVAPVVQPVVAAAAPVAQAAAPIVDAVEPVAEAAAPVAQAATPVLERVAATIEPLAQAAEPVSETAAPVLEQLSAATSPLTGSITTSVGPTVAVIIGIGDEAGDMITPIVGNLGGAVAPISEGAVDTISPVIDEIVDTVAPIVDDVIDRDSPIIDVAPPPPDRPHLHLPDLPSLSERRVAPPPPGSDLPPSVTDSTDQRGLLDRPSKPVAGRSTHLGATETGDESTRSTSDPLTPLSIDRAVEAPAGIADSTAGQPVVGPAVTTVATQDVTGTAVPGHTPASPAPTVPGGPNHSQPMAVLPTGIPGIGSLSQRATTDVSWRSLRVLLPIECPG
jgi:hypothetical protein